MPNTQLHCTAGKEFAAAQKVHSGHLTISNTSCPAQVRSDTKELGGNLESGREAGGKKRALFSMVFIKVRSLIASVRVTGPLWWVPTLVCKAKQ